LRLFEAEFKL